MDGVKILAELAERRQLIMHSHDRWCDFPVSCKRSSASGYSKARIRRSDFVNNFTRRQLCDVFVKTVSQISNTNLSIIHIVSEGWARCTGKCGMFCSVAFNACRIFIVPQSACDIKTFLLDFSGTARVLMTYVNL